MLNLKRITRNLIHQLGVYLHISINCVLQIIFIIMHLRKYLIFCYKGIIACFICGGKSTHFVLFLFIINAG